MLLKPQDTNRNKIKCCEQLHVSAGEGETLSICSMHDIKTRQAIDKHGNILLGAYITDLEIPRKSREGAVLRTEGQNQVTKAQSEDSSLPLLPD